MEQELDYQEKVRLDLEAVLVAIYIYLLMFILMNYSKDLMKIYFLNAQYLLLMQLLELLLKSQQLMEEKQK